MTEESPKSAFQNQMDNYLRHVSIKAVWDELKGHLQYYISSDAREASKKLLCKSGAMSLEVDEEIISEVLDEIQAKIDHHLENMENP